MPPVQIVAHRGACSVAPENTRSALRIAYECGAPWAEVDVQRTSDGTAVLVHDDTWDRTANKSATVRGTPWETVDSFDVGSWFSQEFENEPVPRLDEVLQWTKHLSLNLEIKSPENDPGLAGCVAQAVQLAGVQQRTLLSSFDSATIASLAEDCADLRLAYLGHVPQQEMHPRVRWQILEATALLRNPDWVEEVRQQGGTVWAWTVDQLQPAQRLVQLGVEGLITNQPQKLLAHFG